MSLTSIVATLELAVTMGVMFGSSSIDFTEPTNLFITRVLYVLVQIASLIVSLLCLRSISLKKNQKTITVPAAPSFANPQPNQETTKTIEEYDSEEAWKELKQSIISKIILVPLIHYKWETVMPLLLQIATTPFHIYKSPLVKAHLLGEDIPRPFPAPSGLLDTIKRLQGQVDEPIDNKEKDKDSKKDL